MNRQGRQKLSVLRECSIWRDTSICPGEKLFLLVAAYTLLAILSFSIALVVGILGWNYRSGHTSDPVVRLWSSGWFVLIQHLMQGASAPHVPRSQAPPPSLHVIVGLRGTRAFKYSVFYSVKFMFL